jgi:hypothetical protein
MLANPEYPEEFTKGTQAAVKVAEHHIRDPIGHSNSSEQTDQVLAYL